MKCWKCGAEQEDPQWGKLSFRAECEACFAALHSCRNCRFYKIGLPNDCMVPGTEFIFDREKMNFCEEFKLLGEGPTDVAIDPKSVEKKLFGDNDDEKKPKDFNSLFKD